MHKKLSESYIIKTGENQFHSKDYMSGDESSNGVIDKEKTNLTGFLNFFKIKIDCAYYGFLPSLYYRS